MRDRTHALLVLEDGSAFSGYSVGAEGEWTGEVVFNTSIAGYQEIITDPACWGQMVVLTNPHIGNAGVNAEDSESPRPQVRALLARKICERPSNYRAAGSLPDYMRTHGVPALTSVDTRGLTLLLRRIGPLRGALSTCNLDRERLLQMARATPPLASLAPVREVAARSRAVWTAPLDRAWLAEMKDKLALVGAPPRVVVIDLGGRESVLRHLALMGISPVVLPPEATPEAVLAEQPQGVIVSSGPGNPEQATETVAVLRRLLAAQPALPLCGIGLGMQLVALALGARVLRLPVGHRADNVPVLDLTSGRIEITSQNHQYAVAPDSLAGLPLVATHTNLNDGSIEGLRHAQRPVWGIQFQPEGSPGPHDSLHLLYEFANTLTERAPHA
jgi:carbamoyl-phosphate synthase small subunit